MNLAGNDFRLQSGSPALTGGIDFLDLNNNGSASDAIARGAYITGNETIGRTTGSAPDTLAPSAPGSFRVAP
ncbi:MAG: hypothetical protein IT290_01005 [Deltaproteobacteria bacterium]|nr:hypothetical protein [Deltaproteobacteria bacterium]